MLFKLTDEQLMIQNMVREFSRKVIAATAAERDRTREFPADNFRQMGELGLMGMMIPEAYGGNRPMRSPMCWPWVKSPIPAPPPRW